MEKKDAIIFCFHLVLHVEGTDTVETSTSNVDAIALRIC